VLLVAPIHGGKDAITALAIRFQIVSTIQGAEIRGPNRGFHSVHVAEAAFFVAATTGESTRIQLCGQLSVELDGRQLAHALRGRQVRLLLAYLLLNRLRPVGREELIGALWPEDAPQSQDAALRTLLSRLRSALGTSALAGRSDLMLVLPEPVWVDFEAARAELNRALAALDRDDARAAWGLAQVPLNVAARGLLPGIQATWLEPFRNELDDIRLQALEVVGGAGLRLGGAQLGSVERAARTLIQVEPYRESGYVLLMQSHALRGNSAEAIRVFDRLRVLLREELGTAPSQDAIIVHEQLLRGQRAAKSTRSTVSSTAPVELPAELRARGQGPLVGRTEELAELTRLWGLARGDEVVSPALTVRAPRVVVLSGDAGIGKTSLASELARRAHSDGAVVLAGRAPEEGLAPYQVFLEALSHYFATASLDDIRSAVREHGPELAQLVPELRRRVPELPTAPAEPDGERYRLFEAVVGLLSSASQHAPILLVLDDLHWADRPTLLLLRHLARAPRPDRLMVLISFRTEAATGTLHDALADLSHEGLSSQLDIAGLSEPDTGELVQLRAGQRPSASVRREIHRESEGNPFFVEEIIRNLVAAGLEMGSATALELQRLELPEGVKRLLTRRLDRLDPGTTEFLRVASVAGRDFDAELVEGLVDLGEGDFLAALEGALAAGVLLETTGVPGRYSFSHALIREALYEGMSSPRRARLHRRVGEALEASGQASLSALALHFTRATGVQDAEKAISYATQAGLEATAVLAHEEAVEHYSRALEVVTRAYPEDAARRLELLLAMGEACVRAGERARSRDVLLEAGRLAEQLDDVPSLVRAVVGAARRYVQQLREDTELIAYVERALQRTAGQQTRERVRLLARACGTFYYSSQRGRMEALSQEAVRIAHELDDPEALAYGCSARRAALWDPTHLDERLEASTAMLTAARQVGELELQLQAHAWLVVDLLERGDRDGVDAQIDTFRVGAEVLRQPLFRWQALIWRGMRALLDGSLLEAEEAAAEALAAGAPAETITAPQYYTMQLLNVRREQGRGGEIENAIRDMALANPHRPGWRVGMGLIAWDTGRPDEARAEFERVAEINFAEVIQDGEWLPTMALLSQLCILVGDRERAAVLADLLEPYAANNIVRGVGAVCLGSTSRLLGRLTAMLGRRTDARGHFEAALEAAAALRAPLLRAHTELDYAEALGATGRMAWLVDEAAATARELDLPAVARRAERLG
jgi:DNA-binding SARP family transcriptional activator/tetratricopeptide (TPR) repeat protein